MPKNSLVIEAVFCYNIYMIKAIIFDFGGPIVEWETGSDAVFRKHEDHRNLERDTLRKLFDDYFRGGHVGDFNSVEDYYEKTKPSIGLTIEELNEIFLETHAAMHIKEEMVEYIQQLKQRYKIGLLSNFTNDLEKFLKDVFGIYHLFDVVVNSYDVKVKKPDPRIYVHILNKLNVKPEEAIFIDDLEENIKGAMALGIKGIIFKDVNQCKVDLNKILA